MSLQPTRLGKVDPEPVTTALVFSRHLGGGVAELPLHMAFVNLGGRGEAGAQRMAREFLRPLALAQVAAHDRSFPRSRSAGSLRAPTSLALAVKQRNSGRGTTRTSFSLISSVPLGKARQTSHDRSPLAPVGLRMLALKGATAVRQYPPKPLRERLRSSPLRHP